MKWRAQPVQVVTPKPGDVLVVECPTEVSNEQAELIIAKMGDLFPGHKCVVFSDGMQIKVVREQDLEKEQAPTHVEV